MYSDHTLHPLPPPTHTLLTRPSSDSLLEEQSKIAGTLLLLLGRTRYALQLMSDLPLFSPPSQHAHALRESTVEWDKSNAVLLPVTAPLLMLYHARYAMQFQIFTEHHARTNTLPNTLMRA